MTKPTIAHSEQQSIKAIYLSPESKYLKFSIGAISLLDAIRNKVSKKLMYLFMEEL